MWENSRPLTPPANDQCVVVGWWEGDGMATKVDFDGSVLRVTVVLSQWPKFAHSLVATALNGLHQFR
ncbi:unnamed protein product [Mesocestoides corti]|uniref:DUF397 domain-containing protein n=1 Tax=Mesocestoides corti TaxID=53468 RepID=A0A0R3U2N4_MESCO|nr:unnamed protein product [Mesocestoides corti]